MTKVEIEASANGGYLIFWPHRLGGFRVEAGNGQFWGCAEVSTHEASSPATLFVDMAEHWRGWKGEKTWSDLDAECVLVATCDSFGHVALGVHISGFTYTSKLTVTLALEAGQLEQLAKRMLAAFPIGADEPWP